MVAAQVSEPAAKTSNPATRVRRRPMSSASAPVGSSAIARPSDMALSSHGTTAGPAPSEAAVRATVPSGVTKATRTSSVAPAATRRVRAAYGGRSPSTSAGRGGAVDDVGVSGCR